MHSFKSFFVLSFILVFTWLCLIFTGKRLQASGITQSAYNLVQNSGSSLPQRQTINCTGSLTCSDSGGITVMNATGGGSGNTITLGDCSALPGSSATAGNMYKANGIAQPYEWFWTGAAWQQYFLGFKSVAPPAIGSLTWRNQGTSTYTTIQNCQSSMAIQANSSLNWRFLEYNAALPATPFSFTMTFSIASQAYFNSQTFGIGVTDGTKYRTCEMLFQASGVLTARFENLTDVNTDGGTIGTYVDLSTSAPTQFVLKYTDDGTNTQCFWSGDGGTTFEFVGLQGRTGFLTGTNLDFGGIDTNAGGGFLTDTIWSITQGTN